MFMQVVSCKCFLLIAVVCSQPKLLSIPEGDWYCTDCIVLVSMCTIVVLMLMSALRLVHPQASQTHVVHQDNILLSMSLFILLTST